MKKLHIIFIAVVTCVLFPQGGRSEVIGGGDLTFKPKGARPVLFSHEKHVAGSGLKCAGCHYAIFRKNHGSYKMEMEKIKKGDFCGKCHNGQKTFDVKDQQNCVRCHRE